jgi:hypothetical protein
MENIVDHLSSEMRGALERAVKETVPEAQFDRYQLFRAFKRALRSKCSTWVRVPDHFVDTT